MAGKINGIALGAVGAGGLFLYAGITGKDVLAAIQAIISGKSPATAKVKYPIIPGTSGSTGPLTGGGSGLYPGAVNRLLRNGLNHNAGGHQPRLLIVHIMQGSLAGADEWFHNPVAQVSAHFGVGKDGTVYQWVSTNDTAWHAAAANSHSIGVEHEGLSGQTLTQAQVNATGQIYAWARQQYPAITPTLAQNPKSSGLAYHALGGLAWGGHFLCPGLPIVAQLPSILQASGG